MREDFVYRYELQDFLFNEKEQSAENHVWWAPIYV